MNRLYFDLETSPNIVLSWRVGYKINLDHDNLLKERAIICIAYKWAKEKKVNVLTWDKEQNDRAALAEFIEEANKADEIVAHNGDRFDLPWVRTRCLYHDIPMMPAYKSVDTLQWARRKFYFNSNRLDYLGKFMGLGGKIKTEFGLWKKILMDNDPKAMALMVKYAKRDVAMLQEVHEKLELYVPHKTHNGVLNGRDKWTSPFATEGDGTNIRKSQTRVTAAGTKMHAMQCKDTGRYYQISDAAYKQYQEYLLDKNSNNQQKRKK